MVLLFFYFSFCHDRGVQYIDLDCTKDKTGRQVLTVYGKGIKSIETALKQTVNDNGFTNMDIEVQEHGYYYFNQFCGGKRNVHGDIKVVQRVIRGEEWVAEGEASCGLILFGTAKNTVNEPTALYAVFSAHLVLDTSECEKVLGLNKDLQMANLIDKIREQNSSYSLHFHNSEIVLDLVENPLLAYSHYHTMEEKERATHMQFLKDVAISKLAERGNLGEDIQEAMSKRELYSGNDAKVYKIAEVLPIMHPRELTKLQVQQIDVKVGSINGHLIFPKEASWRKAVKHPDMMVKSFCAEFKTLNQ